MKRRTAYFFVVLLYGLTALCALGAVNTLVSRKYEADEARIFIGMNKSRAEKQKGKRAEALNEYDKQLATTYYLWVGGAVTAALGATSILIRRFRKPANV